MTWPMDTLSEDQTECTHDPAISRQGFGYPRPQPEAMPRTPLLSDGRCDGALVSVCG
jgi:hypothetical protein